jgi:hypothetical protein
MLVKFDIIVSENAIFYGQVWQESEEWHGKQRYWIIPSLSHLPSLFFCFFFWEEIGIGKDTHLTLSSTHSKLSTQQFSTSAFLCRWQCPISGCLSLFEESLQLRCVLVGEGVIWGYPLRDYCALLWYDVRMKAVRKSECSPIVEGDGIIFFQHLIMNLLDWRLRQWVAEAVRGREAAVTFYVVASTTTAGTRHRQRYGKSSRCGYWHRKLLLVKCCHIGVKWSLWRLVIFVWYSWLCYTYFGLFHITCFI